MAKYSTTDRYVLDDTGMTATRYPVETSTYYTYISRQGDSFESLAARLFNDGRRYWEIADLNPQVPFPDYIEVGTVIRIPQ